MFLGQTGRGIEIWPMRLKPWDSIYHLQKKKARKETPSGNVVAIGYRFFNSLQAIQRNGH
jgi:hypothetical protein